MPALACPCIKLTFWVKYSLQICGKHRSNLHCLNFKHFVFFLLGSELLLQPDVYVTVVAWTPFMTDGAQAVLHQGRLINQQNLEQFMDTVSEKLQSLEQRLACMADDVHDNIQVLLLKYIQGDQKSCLGSGYIHCLL